MSGDTGRPAFCVAAPSSGGGKTTVVLGLLASLRRRGLKTQPFKCGPDYIDAGLHWNACGVESVNLDTWMMGGEDSVVRSFRKAAGQSDCSVVEGVMGMFDGVGRGGIEGSTAHVAKTLSLPVVLVVNCRGMAGSIAPLVKGFADFDPGVTIAGVIANKVGSEKHAELLSEALRESGLPPLLGFLPRNPEWSLPERHLGLVPGVESGVDEKWFESLADAVEKHIDIDGLLALRSSPSPIAVESGGLGRSSDARGGKPVLAYAKDAAFHFYYRENLEMMIEAGIELVPFSPLTDDSIPENADGLYIGGGFPEMFAERLSRNVSLRESIRVFAEAGGAIFAECGGFMYLGESLADLSGTEFPMCGVVAGSFRMEPRLHRLGYVEIELREESLFGKAGTVVRGHEFHWSSFWPRENSGSAPMGRLRKPGAASGEWKPAGVRVKDTWASFAHFHFASNPDCVLNLREWLLSKRV
ncbi:MAG: cobyrinate a,c-diamide synthase [Kiritimatiellaeota bacterium]|nr:cobyrinate a,c-diamide synthase [Kiritimatiellota bacterium]